MTKKISLFTVLLFAMICPDTAQASSADRSSEGRTRGFVHPREELANGLVAMLLEKYPYLSRDFIDYYRILLRGAGDVMPAQVVKGTLRLASAKRSANDVEKVLQSLWFHYRHLFGNSGLYEERLDLLEKIIKPTITGWHLYAVIQAVGEIGLEDFESRRKLALEFEARSKSFDDEDKADEYRVKLIDILKGKASKVEQDRSSSSLESSTDRSASTADSATDAGYSSERFSPSRRYDR